MGSILSVEEVQEYLRDKVELNLLSEGEEFSPTFINIAMELAVSEFNLVPPIGSVTKETFPNKALLMSGTLYKLFAGQAALSARNTMSYTDGGLSIPIEEAYSMYRELSALFQADFVNGAKQLKIFMNIESGWGGVSSDYSRMPTW